MLRIDPNKIRIALPSIQQMRGTDCGVAVLLSIFTYYGVRNVERQRLAKALRTNRNGTAPTHIIRVARRHGFHATMVHGMSLDALFDNINQRRPVVLSLQAYGTGHYVAAVGYDRKRVYLRDPMAEGEYVYIARNELLGRWWDIEMGLRTERLGLVVYRNSQPLTLRCLPIPP